MKQTRHENQTYVNVINDDSNALYQFKMVERIVIIY